MTVVPLQIGGLAVARAWTADIALAEQDKVRVPPSQVRVLTPMKIQHRVDEMVRASRARLVQVRNLLAVVRDDLPVLPDLENEDPTEAVAVESVRRSDVDVDEK